MQLQHRVEVEVGLQSQGPGFQWFIMVIMGIIYFIIDIRRMLEKYFKHKNIYVK